jgi:hypothetical protein
MRDAANSEQPYCRCILDGLLKLRLEVDRLPEEHEKRRRVISPWKSSVPRKERRFSGVKFYKGRLLI